MKKLTMWRCDAWSICQGVSACQRPMCERHTVWLAPLPLARALVTRMLQHQTAMLTSKSRCFHTGRKSCVTQRRPAPTRAPCRPMRSALAAAPPGNLLQFLPNIFKRQSPEEQQLQQDRDRLLALLLRVTGPPATAKEVDQLVASLASSEQPFDERKLGGGAWQVFYTSGAAQLWKATYAVGKVANQGNIASQNFDPQGRTALNRAEYWGSSVWVSASGTYEPVDEGKRCPKQIQANISGGLVSLWGWKVALPIKGTGFFEVCYLDSDLRVFRSGRSYAVQIRAGALDQLRERLAGA